jgi:hypothetical protein
MTYFVENILSPASAATLPRRFGVVFEYSKSITKKLSVACDYYAAFS